MGQLAKALQLQCCSPYVDACQALATMPSPDKAFEKRDFPKLRGKSSAYINISNSFCTVLHGLPMPAPLV